MGRPRKSLKKALWPTEAHSWVSWLAYVAAFVVLLWTFKGTDPGWNVVHLLCIQFVVTWFFLYLVVAFAILPAIARDREQVIAKRTIQEVLDRFPEAEKQISEETEAGLAEIERKNRQRVQEFRELDEQYAKARGKQ